MVKNTPGPEPYRAIYGFSFNLFFTSLFALYVIWVLALGYSKHFYFVPDTYFAFSLPMFVLCGIVLFLILYPSVNMAQTADVESLIATKDSSVPCKCLEGEEQKKNSAADEGEIDFLSTSTSFAVDVDLSHVSKVLYSKEFNV